MNHDKRTVGILCTLAAVLLLLGFLYQKKTAAGQGTEPVTAQGFKLNTIVTVTLYDSDDKALAEEALALCDQYEKLFSRTLSSSELYRLNQRNLPSSDGWYTLSDETADLIAAGLHYSALSQGAFDLTIEPVSSLWDFTSEEKTVPEASAIEAALPLVDYTQVSLSGNQIRFGSPGMGIDLGAVAKGYIADRIKDFLLENGVRSGIINLGGNVLCIGERPDGKPFKIGIQKPFADRSETLCTVDITDRSVVSSGIYERCFELDGQFYHHLLNPSTGYPYDNGLVSVTVLSDSSADGDGLSTSCFALGLEKGLELINSLEDVEAIFVTEDYEIYYSDDFEDAVTLS